MTVSLVINPSLVPKALSNTSMIRQRMLNNWIYALTRVVLDDEQVILKLLCC